MKKLTMSILLGMSAISGVHAVGMCVPNINTYSLAYTDITTYQNANRGYWTVGGKCTNDTNYTTISCTEPPKMRGESHCSSSGISPGTSGWESYGQNCWCRLTHSVASNGLLTEVDAGWVAVDQGYGGTSSFCATTCSSRCAGSANSKIGRAVMLFVKP